MIRFQPWLPLIYVATEIEGGDGRSRLLLWIGFKSAVVELSLSSARFLLFALAGGGATMAVENGIYQSSHYRI
ncbi:hypothetical protein ACLOJK_035113 [Asimina triloba]